MIQKAPSFDSQDIQSWYKFNWSRGIPLCFFGIVRPYCFQYNQTAVISSIIYHSLGCFDTVFFRNFHLNKGYVPAFLSVFGLRRVVSKLKVFFRHLETFSKTIELIFKKEIFCNSSWGNCGFRALCVSFGVLFGTEIWIDFVFIC